MALKKKKVFSGSYAAKSRFLMASGFRFELLEAFENDVAAVEISAGKLIKSKFILNLSRKKKK